MVVLEREARGSDLEAGSSARVAVVAFGVPAAGTEETATEGAAMAREVEVKVAEEDREPVAVVERAPVTGRVVEAEEAWRGACEAEV